MPAKSARRGASQQKEPVIHDLPPLRYEGAEVAVRLEIRRGEDGTWRGRLIFGGEDASGVRSTAEIFCAITENDLWQSVRGFRDHHFRDLYRSVSE